MSTQYYLMPELKTKCRGEFPASFGSFLESEDGYGEESEYFKVCKATGKDLNIFREKAVGFEDNSESNWVNIETVKDSLDNFLQALEKVSIAEMNLKYDPRKQKKDSLFIYTMMPSTPENDKLRDEYYKLDDAIHYDTTHPFYFFPKDKKYISGRKLNKDIHKLIRLLECYEKEGNKRVKIVYE